MLKSKIGIGVVVLLFAVGCVRSVQPFYTEEDVVFEPGLIGSWVQEKAPENAKDKEPSKDVWTFSSTDQKTYKLVIQEKEKSGTFDATLMKLDGKLFLDLCPVQPELKESDFYKYHLLPTHTLIYVQQLDAGLKMRLPSIEWIGKYLEKNPDALQHTVVSGESSQQVLLTAPTKDLQAFWLKHLETEKAYIDWEKMIKK